MVLNNLETIILFLLNYYPKENIGEETIRIFKHALSDLPIEKLKTAVNLYCDTNEWFPSSPAVLRNIVRELITTEAEAVRHDVEQAIISCPICDGYGFIFMPNNFCRRCSHDPMIEDQKAFEFLPASKEVLEQGPSETLREEVKKNASFIKKYSIPPINLPNNQEGD